MPTFDGGDDFVRVGGPCEGLGVSVVGDEEAVDGCLKVGERSEDAAFETTPGEDGKEAFDGIEPRGRGGREVEGEACVAIEPRADLGMLMGGIIVENDMDGLTVGDLGVDGVEEADELLMAVALHVLADDGAIEDVERGKERGRPMSLVIVGHGSEASLFHRQTGLGAVERLDLGFLVHREHDGVGRRIDIEADNVAQLSGEVRIVGELELPPAIGLEAVCLPDAPDRAGADAGGLGHHVTGPVRRLPGRITERQRDDPFGGDVPVDVEIGGQALLTLSL